MNTTAQFRYVTLADEIQENIQKGTFSPGDKLPSLRKLHHQLGLSISTVHQAYIELEKRGRVEAKEKSGFYVKALSKNPLRIPGHDTASGSPSRVKINDLAEIILKDLRKDEMLKLGASVPSKTLMPLKQLARIMKSMHSESLVQHMSNYDLCPGNQELRDAIAKRMIGAVVPITADDIVTTCGCLDAISLCLRAVAEPGDTILVESPAFHSFLQLIEDLNMFVVEVSGHPEKGIDPGKFEAVLLKNNIKACLLNPNFQNPLGSVIPLKRKKSILEIATRLNVPIIEDDIYGDLFFGKTRPATFKGLDTNGMVLYCSSFSKSLAPGLRAGWTIPGRYIDAVIRMKLNTVISSPSITHTAVARFIGSGAYDRHLRQYRRRLKNQASAMAIAVSKYFPADTRLSFPRGGMFLWVELNRAVDSFEVYQNAYRENISILPGIICSSSDRYKNCLRINCSLVWSPRLERGIQTLGRIVKRLIPSDPCKPGVNAYRN